MAKKVNEVQNGDLKSNIVVLRSVLGKVGQKYFIQPQRDSRGRYASCVKRVDAHGDIVLTPEELAMEAKGEAENFTGRTLDDAVSQDLVDFEDGLDVVDEVLEDEVLEDSFESYTDEELDEFEDNLDYLSEEGDE